MAAIASRPLSVEHPTEKVVLEHSVQLETGFSTKYTISSIWKMLRLEAREFLTPKVLQASITFMQKVLNEWTESQR
jgi:hypothetical protein